MLQVRPEGMYCVPGNFYIDPWQPVDSAIITHGHADHARPGMKKYLCHRDTEPILKSRIGRDIAIQGIGYQETLNIQGVKVSLHPAGHIIGSAQIRLAYQGKVTVVSGDYKLQHDGLSTPFEPVRCDEFVTESTFGLPIYNWLDIEAQHTQLTQWVHNNQRDGKTSVFIAYSLGKAQRIMKALEGLAPIYVHPAIGQLNQAYESVGIRLPDYQIINLANEAKKVDQQIVLLPPALLDSQVIRKIPHMAKAICSGWMQVRGARRWRSADAGFAISDHADWSGLLEAVRATGAEKIYVTHGQTAAFARYLNEQGFSAEEINTRFGEEESEID